VVWQKNDAHFFCPIAKRISRLSIDKFFVLTLFCDSWHEPEGIVVEVGKFGQGGYPLNSERGGSELIWFAGRGRI